ncbi:MAG TPA: polyhydroxyalkanoate synthesis regulator DNA-binding domain-containing protein, partial [Chloroflexaceae bacterium]|nr:polyhydroxyalkanoate synthesis regulator DNA-binding domain-containing protein [Chloroflexaceae bacterium]
MHLIKKYANRKLYHTNQKQYITLEGIARLVQEGEPVQVLDNETGDDITSTILAQVVLTARGRSGPQLPTQLLTGLIQIGGDTLTNLRRTLASS